MQLVSSQWSKCGHDSYKAERAVTNLSSNYSLYVNCYGKLKGWCELVIRMQAILNAKLPSPPTTCMMQNAKQIILLDSSVG